MRRAWCVWVTGAPVVAFGFSGIVPFGGLRCAISFLR